MAIFGISDYDMMKNGIKIIDGIAGAGKSSMIDKFFRDQNISYSRLTSTNRLRRDAMDRYNMPVKTIAAGMFVNHGMHFYAEEKEPMSQYMVIDEILQADPKAIEWCINHANDTDIIITTDSKQLMSPENEDRMKEAFAKLCRMPDVIYKNLTTTLRARDEKTRQIYNKFYGIADTEMTFDLESLIDTFPNVIEYKDMVYSPSDAYITHDNLTEDYMYKDQNFTSNPLLDLVPKGCLSSNPPKDLSKYPVLSQLEANKTKARSYTQVMNVGSAVRFQGSEVTDDQKLYFIVQPGSKISARELYTVLTRMWNINSFIIVVIETPSPYVLKTFNGLPVKTHKYLTVHEKVETSTKLFTTKQMEEFLSNYDTDTVYYDRDEVRGLNATYAVRSGVRREEYPKRKSTAGSLARRDSSLNYSYMDAVYSILDKNGVTQTKCIHKKGSHTESNYMLDLYSAHPTLLKFEKMPSDGFIEYDMPHDNMLNFYLYRGTVFTNECVITDDMKNYIEANNLGECTYLFSTPFVVGCFPGDWLYEKAHDTQESKKDIKQIHYGYYQKPYLKLSLSKDCYVRYESNIYELLICQIFSQLTYYMMKLFDELNGTSIIIDAVCFPCYNEDVLKKIKSLLPDYIDFRIKDKDGNVLFQTYSNLPTKAAKKVAQRKAQRAKKKLELEAIRNKVKEDSL